MWNQELVLTSKKICVPRSHDLSGESWVYICSTKPGEIVLKKTRRYTEKSVYRKLLSCEVRRYCPEKSEDIALREQWKLSWEIHKFAEKPGLKSWEGRLSWEAKTITLRSRNIQCHEKPRNIILRKYGDGALRLYPVQTAPTRLS